MLLANKLLVTSDNLIWHLVLIAEVIGAPIDLKAQGTPVFHFAAVQDFGAKPNDLLVFFRISLSWGGHNIDLTLSHV